MQITYLEPKIKPQFKVGDKFEYKSTSANEEMTPTETNTFFVKNIERINGSDYYLLFNPGDVGVKESGSNITGTTYYINKKTGYVAKSVFRLVYGDGRVEEMEDDKERILINLFMYDQW